MIARDSQRQRRQGTQPPYSDAYLSGMPNKRRKIVTSSKPQGSLPQMIASKLIRILFFLSYNMNKLIILNVCIDF